MCNWRSPLIRRPTNITRETTSRSRVEGWLRNDDQSLAALDHQTECSIASCPVCLGLGNTASAFMGKASLFVARGDWPEPGVADALFGSSSLALPTSSETSPNGSFLRSVHSGNCAGAGAWVADRSWHDL